MSIGVGLEILWSPVHANKFIAWGPDLFLYQIGPLQDRPTKSTQSCLQTSELTQAVLLATDSHHRYVKCVDIHPKPDSDILLAVGQTSGKVSLTSFGMAISVTGKEFAPNSPRQCNSVAWNKVDTNYFASALDKSRVDHAILLWNAYGCSHSDRPVVEFGMVGDQAHSLTWLNASTLIAGMNNKYVRLLDKRVAGIAGSAQTKAVYGVCASTHNDDLIASFFDSQICVWDLRNFEKPITTAIRQKNVTKILWSPTRHKLLGSLQRDSGDIVLHDLQLPTVGQVGNEEVEPTLLERPIQPCPGTKITSFSWHPTIDSRLLTISMSWIVTDYTVLDRITLNWLPSDNLIWSHGFKEMKVISARDSIYASLNDISVLIKKRALTDYGLKPELWQNGELAENENLKDLWYWLNTSRNLVEEGIVRDKWNSNHPGVLALLTVSRRSESLFTPWTDLPSQSNVKMYRSDERDAAIQLCGWRYEKCDKDIRSLNGFLECLQNESSFTRAAAIAVFNLNIGVAIGILNRGANRKQLPELGIVAMALAGYSSDMWKMYVSQALAKLQDPYIRAMFAFLTAEPEKYDAVLNESKMLVADRVAFACIFLSDTKLLEFLTKLSEKLTDEGVLAGVLLTGATSEGVKLLQKYLDITGDVQSVSLLAIRSLTYETLKDTTVQCWIAGYQSLLDSCKLWSQRAHFDITMNLTTNGEKVLHQMYVTCNFCQKNISGSLQGLTRNRAAVSRLGPSNNKIKMSSCPNCRKPLPRCAICLVHVGTPSRLNDNKISDLASWFTWCQTCRHGGHTDHIQRWFLNHNECPVTGCTCRCMTVDGSYHHGLIS